MPRIAPEGQERRSGSLEEEAIEHAGVALRERVQGMRQGEDDVEVRDRQEVGAPGVDAEGTGYSRLRGLGRSRGEQVPTRRPWLRWK
jgi:hypothetical protein